MRIVAGTHRGRILKTPQNSHIRPTSDKVRQALFNALNSRGAVIDAVVLDAFCGTGALGLEALSQGAAQAVFFDTAKISLSLAQENARLLKEDGNASFLQKDATKPGMKPDDVLAASLVFLDPPYHKNLVPQALSALQENGWIAPDAWIVAEAEKGGDLSALGGAIDFEKTYGDTRVLIVRL